MTTKNDDSIKEIILQLRREITKHNKLYYQDDKPEITDAQYDKLFAQLVEYEKKYPQYHDENSPTQTVGYKIKKEFTKVTHAKNMLSLDNIFDIEGLQNWIKKVRNYLNDKTKDLPSNKLEKENEDGEMKLFDAKDGEINDSKRQSDKKEEDKMKNDGAKDSDKTFQLEYCNDTENKPLSYKLYLEPKIDGISFSAYYKDGKLDYVATRGDGKVGENITDNVKTIKNFPHNLNKIDKEEIPKELEVRGEIYMTKKTFEKINKTLKKEQKQFANSRNAVAGSVRQLDTKITAQRNLQYFVYDVARGSEYIKVHTQEKLFQTLKKLGFLVNDISRSATTIKQIQDYYKYILDKRYQLDYDIDGIVYKIDDFDTRQRLGYVSRSPRYAIAHKLPTLQAVTKLIKIELQVGRTGAITPVAHLEPINVGGVVVSRATLHNKDEIERKDIREGDIVTIQRAGDVIPQVIEVQTDRRTIDIVKYQFPSRCPSCDSKLEIPDNKRNGNYDKMKDEEMKDEEMKDGNMQSDKGQHDKVSDSKVKQDKQDIVIRCNNIHNCKAQQIEKLKHFVSKNAFDIQGLGKKQIEELYNVELIKSFDDIFLLEQKQKEYETYYQSIKNNDENQKNNDDNIKTNQDEVQEVKNKILRYREGWGFISVKNLYDSIKQSKNVTLDRFIYALGIRFLGEINAKILANHFANIDKFQEFMDNVSQANTEEKIQKIKDNISNLDGIGNKLVDSLVETLKDNIIRKNIQDLIDVVVVKKYLEDIEENNPIKMKFINKTILFTGKLTKMSRDEAKNLAKNNGFKIVSTVTKKLDYLVVGDKPGTKLKQAQELNVEILLEIQWINMIKID